MTAQRIPRSSSFRATASPSPLVYESTNEPYNSEGSTGGCAIDPDERGRTTLGLALIVALVGLRRRRA